MQNTIKEFYGTQDAVDYLQTLWGAQGIKITKDKFYHAIARSGKAYKKQVVGKVERYRFTEEDLKDLRFYGGTTTRTEYPHVQIHSLDELKELEAVYGELTTEEGLVAILKKRFNKEYKVTSIRQRLRRGDIDYVAYGQEGKYKTFWYPIGQLKDVRFYPKLVKNNS